MAGSWEGPHDDPQPQRSRWSGYLALVSLRGGCLELGLSLQSVARAQQHLVLLWRRSAWLRCAFRGGVSGRRGGSTGAGREAVECHCGCPSFRMKVMPRCCCHELWLRRSSIHANAHVLATYTVFPRIPSASRSADGRTIQICQFATSEGLPPKMCSTTLWDCVPRASHLA